MQLMRFWQALTGESFAVMFPFAVVTPVRSAQAGDHVVFAKISLFLSVSGKPWPRRASLLLCAAASARGSDVSLCS